MENEKELRRWEYVVFRRICVITTECFFIDQLQILITLFLFQKLLFQLSCLQSYSADVYEYKDIYILYFDMFIFFSQTMWYCMDVAFIFSLVSKFIYFSCEKEVFQLNIPLLFRKWLFPQKNDKFIIKIL